MEWSLCLMAKLLAEFSNLTKKEEEVKLGSVAGMDGMVFMFDGEAPEVGGAVWIMAEDETKVPVPVGEHQLEGGGVLVVSEEGIIARKLNQF
jgi:hypothetical protein